MTDQIPAPRPLSFEGNVSENWRRWLQQYKLYMCATEKEKKSEKLQCATLLSLAGESAIELYNTFTFEEDQVDKIKSIIDKFDEYCTPKKHETYERHVFNSRTQKVGESFDQFLTDLRVLSKDCKFGELKDSLIRDRVIEGLSDDQTRRRLLRDKDLTLDRCIESCRAAEATAIRMKTISDQPVDQKAHSVDSVRHKQGKNTQAGRKGNAPNNTRSTLPQSQNNRCSRCGFDHRGRQCPAKGKGCFKCGGQDHFKKMCRSASNGKAARRNVNQPQRGDRSVHSVDTEFFVDTVQSQSQGNDCWVVPIDINESVIPMKLDTGSDVNILSFNDFQQLNKRPKLHNSHVKLKAYNGGIVPVKGQCMLTLRYKNRTHKALFIIGDSSVKPILGRKLCDDMSLVKRVLSVEQAQTAQKDSAPVDMFTEYSDVFEGLGCLAGEVNIKLRDNAVPVVEPCRKVPFALHEELRVELQKMEDLHVIEKVEEPTDWVHSLVIVHKANGKLRICLDPRHLNKEILREHFKLPTREEITSRFAGARYFSKIDASSGFWQLRLNEESSRLCTFNTPFGRYRFLRLPFGISSAPEIYHRTIHTLFEHMDGVDTSMDDIIIWGETEQQHDQRLRNVLDKTREVGLKLQKEKCIIRVSELTFLGDTLSASGLKPDPRKVEAIDGFETPSCKQDLQRFLGMVNYLARFLPELSARTALLRTLLDKDNQWDWTPNHDKAFKDLKSLVTDKPVLQYYDPTKPIRISADASLRGLGAVLLQKHNNDWLPVAYASRAVTDTESRYATIERETLALSFACERFHQYIYGQSIEVETDHKPLIAIFSKGLNESPPRIQRLRLKLQRYDIQLIHTPGRYMYTADALSRAPLNDNSSSTEGDIQIYVDGVMASIQVSDRKQQEIVNETLKDSVMILLVETISLGWPEERHQCPHKLLPFWNYRDELSVINGLVFKGNRVVIPLKLQPDILAKVHAGHMGMEKCKIRAREVVFWPGLNQDIVNMVKSCEPCQRHQKQQMAEPLLSHPLPTRPWQKVSTDLFELDKKEYIVIVDSYSNYPEVISLPNQSSKAVIKVMKSTFARHGIPEEVLSDNGPCYSSSEFAQFACDWDFCHITSSPGYPRSNGLAERTVQTAKSIIRKCQESGEDPHMGLLAYRTTPLENGFSPAQILMGRQLRSNLPIAVSKLAATQSEVVQWRQQQREKQKYYHDKKSVKCLEPLSPGNRVRINHGNKWPQRATVLGNVAPRSYLVQTECGTKFRRNRRDLLPDHTNIQSQDNDIGMFGEPHDLHDLPETSVEDTLPTDRSNNLTTRSGREVRKPERLIEKC